jgi:hypothetical protein
MGEAGAKSRRIKIPERKAARIHQVTYSNQERGDRGGGTAGDLAPPSTS